MNATPLSSHLQPQVDALNAIFAQGVIEVDVAAPLLKAVNSISAIERLTIPLRPRFEYPVYEQAAKELQYALLGVSIGNYRQAFGSLRLFFELFLSGIEFSSSERLFRGWLLGRENIVWNRLIDIENGVLSRNFCALFFDELKEDVPQYRVMAGTVYSECSRFVHGNPSANALLPATLQFRKQIILDWTDKLDTMMLILTFAYSLRYLLDLDEASKESVKEDLLDQLGTVEPIRVVLGGAGG